MPDFTPYRESYAAVPEAHWAYLAGVIDGEGSIYVCYDKRHDIYFIEMSVANTARSLIEWLLENFGGTEKLSGRAERDGCPDQWAWVVRGRKAAPIIAGIMPYLVVKQRQAALAEEFLSTYIADKERSVKNQDRLRIKEAIGTLNCLKGKAR